MEIDPETVALIGEAANEETEHGDAEIAEASFRRFLAADWQGMPAASFCKARDGLDLAYRHYPADGDRAFILLHGSAGHGGHLHVLGKAIAARGAAEVYLPDLRGHGLSGVRRGHSVAYAEQMRDDVEDFVAMVRGRSPHRRTVIGGHSAGGGLGLRLTTSRIAETLAGHLFLAPFFGAQAPTTRAGLGGWVRLYPRRVRALMNLNSRGVSWLNQLTVIEFNQPLATRDGRETLAWSYNTMLAFGPGRWSAELRALAPSRPAMLIVGDADECFVPEAYAPLLADLAPHVAQQIVAGLGHWDLLVATKAAEIIADWLMDRC
jgi:pimeloyl-ACP methyl ester carboxylesterase